MHHEKCEPGRSYWVADLIICTPVDKMVFQVTSEEYEDAGDSNTWMWELFDTEEEARACAEESIRNYEEREREKKNQKSWL